MSDQEWDRDDLNQRFKNTAWNAWEYIKKCRLQVGERPAYEALIDEHMAIWLATDYFIDRTFLESREGMLSELAKIRDRNYEPSGIYEFDRFRRHWRAEIDRIVHNLSASS
jgi:hypothetical protein